ncbi:hypothetical protein [Burkholderia arboris]|uniref:hypothetical protein n=1 Tax=Burkholderia arboris TaxID=488730 RepID=UPI001CA3BD83|nr:hypothetical protein [Burkholderia arboris]MBY8610091.1 hypothetical protein [Burkholderia arboris]MCA8050198.1 hypothetical protein [Burkholderia arboris]
MSADIPAVAFGVVRMAWQVEPVDAQTARMPHAWFGPCGSRAGFGTPVDPAGAAGMAAACSRSARHLAAFLNNVYQACISAQRTEKSPGRTRVQPGQKTPSLGTRMVRGKYKMCRGITKYCCLKNGAVL